MVYEDQTNQDQTKLTDSNQPGLVGASPAGGGVSAPSLPSASPAPSAPVQQRSGSGRFTNLSKYINANKPASQKLGQKIQKNIETEAGNVREGINQSQQKFNTQAQGVESQLNQTSNFVNQIKQDPTQLLSNQESLQNFRNIQSGNISTPEQTLAQNQQALSALQNKADLTKNESGRFQLLQNVFSDPSRSYNRGQKRFDQLLIQGSPDVGANLSKSAQEQLSQTQNMFNPEQQRQMNEAARLASLKQSSASDIANTLGSFVDQGQGELGNLYSQLSQAQMQARSKQESDLAKARESLSKGELNNYTASLLGLDPGTKIYNLDPKQFAGQLGLGDSDITMADVAQESQQSRLNALAQLANLDNVNLGEKSGQIGLTGIDKNQVTQNINQQVADFNNQAANNFRMSGDIGQTYLARGEHDRLRSGAATPQDIVSIADSLVARHGAGVANITPGLKNLFDFANRYRQASGRVIGDVDNTFNVN